MKHIHRNVSRIIFFVILILGTIISSAFAATQTVEADGYYTVGDGAEENFSVARERAKQDALRRAAEQAAVYVEAFTSVKDHRLTASEVRTLTAKVLKVMDAAFVNTVEGNVFKIQCHVVAKVQEDNGVLASLVSDREKLMESLQREQEKDAKIAELNQKMEELTRKYQAAKTDGERAAIRRETQTNDASFMAAQWVEKALRAEDSGDYIQATAFCMKAIELDPKSAWAYSVLGTTYAGKGEYDKAIACYNKAIDLVPNYAGAYHNLAIAFRSKGAYNKAVEYCNTAIALDPNDAFAYFTLGTVNNRIKQYDKAIECFNKVIALAPYDYMAYSNIGGAYYLKGEYFSAADWFGKAIELNPKDAKLYYNRGQAYCEVGKYKEAKKEFFNAYKLDPNDPRIAKAKRISENW